MKNRKVYGLLSLLLVSIICSIMIHFKFKNVKFRDYIENAKVLVSSNEMAFHKKYYGSVNTQFNNNYTSYSQLEKDADVVVVGFFIDRKQISGSMQSNLIVEEVLKGDMKKDDCIIVNEPVYLQDNMLQGSEGYVPLIKNKEYVLFLKKEGKSYNFISDMFGKFPKSKPNGFVSNTKTIPYKEYCEYDYIYINDEVIHIDDLDKEYEQCKYQNSEETCEHIKNQKIAIMMYEGYVDTYVSIWNEIKNVLAVS